MCVHWHNIGAAICKSINFCTHMSVHVNIPSLIITAGRYLGDKRHKYWLSSCSVHCTPSHCSDIRATCGPVFVAIAIVIVANSCLGEWICAWALYLECWQWMSICVHVWHSHAPLTAKQHFFPHEVTCLLLKICLVHRCHVHVPHWHKGCIQHLFLNPCRS